MVAFEKASKAVLKLGPPDPAFIARGEQNFERFAGVLEQSLEGRVWVTGDTLTVADLALGQVIPSAIRFGLPVGEFPNVQRWYGRLADLPAWRTALAAQQAAIQALTASRPRWVRASKEAT
jgi:glutathione S-transferase